GPCRVDGQPPPARMAVSGGGPIVGTPPAVPDGAAPRAQKMPLKIVHEDAALIIIDKPAGLVVHPGAGQPDRTLLNALLAHAPSLGAVPRAGIVHRLDKDTSGLLVVAKTVESQADIVQQLAGDTVYPRGKRHGIEFPRQALHAAELSLRHPSTGEEASWRSPLPRDFKKLVDALRACEI